MVFGKSPLPDSLVQARGRWQAQVFLGPEGPQEVGKSLCLLDRICQPCHS